MRKCCCLKMSVGMRTRLVRLCGASKYDLVLRQEQQQGTLAEGIIGGIRSKLISAFPHPKSHHTASNRLLFQSLRPRLHMHLTFIIQTSKKGNMSGDSCL